ncbi:hypothetical protein D9M68_606490 [compost metagenome]
MRSLQPHHERIGRKQQQQRRCTQHVASAVAVGQRAGEDAAADQEQIAHQGGQESLRTGEAHRLLHIDGHEDDQRIGADGPEHGDAQAGQQLPGIVPEDRQQGLLDAVALERLARLLFAEVGRFVQRAAHPQADRRDRQADDERHAPSPFPDLLFGQQRGDQGRDQRAQKVGDAHAGL